MQHKVLGVHKLSDEGVNKYSQDMRRNIDGKINFFTGAIHAIIQERGCINILDIGCCSGDLLAGIHSQFKKHINTCVGVDISPQMINLAKNKYPYLDFHVANVYDENFIFGQFDIITCSSVLHELGSYFGQKNLSDYNKGIRVGVSTLLSKVRKDGLLLIKDPVMPLLQESKIGLSYKYQTEAYINLNLDINQWDYWSRVQYFVAHFPYFDQIFIANFGDKVICPSIAITEIIRHTSSAICNTMDHFSDELSEWYGSWNAENWNLYISTFGNSVKLLEHKTFWSPKNHSSAFYDFFDFFWENGNKIPYPQKYFPTHQFTILQKI